MTIQAAMHIMVGRTDLVAFRPEGEILVLRSHGALRSVRSGTERPWTPTVHALISDNWQVKTAAEFSAMVRQNQQLAS